MGRGEVEGEGLLGRVGVAPPMGVVSAVPKRRSAMSPIPGMIEAVSMRPTCTSTSGCVSVMNLIAASDATRHTNLILSVRLGFSDSPG